MRNLCKHILQRDMQWLAEYGLVMPDEDRRDFLDTEERIMMEKDVRERGYASDAVHLTAMFVKNEKYRELLYDYLFFSASSDKKEREKYIQKLDKIFYNDEDVVAEIKVSTEYLYAIAKLMKMHDEGEDVILKIKKGANGVKLLVGEGKTFALAIGERLEVSGE